MLYKLAEHRKERTSSVRKVLDECVDNVETRKREFSCAASPCLSVSHLVAHQAQKDNGPLHYFIDRTNWYSPTHGQ